MPVRGPRLLVAVAAALAAGCASPPAVVAGNPAPLTATPSATATRTTPPARPSTPSPTAAPTRPAPRLPAGYGTAELTAHGVTVRLPVPDGWMRTPTARGYDFGDPSGTLLFRVEVTARPPGQTARQAWESLEPQAAPKLPGYRRLDARDLPGYLDGALDWTFLFDGSNGRRQVVDRLAVSGPAVVAVYFSARRADFGGLLPIWDRGVGELTVS